MCRPQCVRGRRRRIWSNEQTVPLNRFSSDWTVRINMCEDYSIYFKFSGPAHTQDTIIVIGHCPRAIGHVNVGGGGRKATEYVGAFATHIRVAAAHICKPQGMILLSFYTTRPMSSSSSTGTTLWIPMDFLCSSTSVTVVVVVLSIRLLPCWEPKSENCLMVVHKNPMRRAKKLAFVMRWIKETWDWVNGGGCGWWIGIRVSGWRSWWESESEFRGWMNYGDIKYGYARIEMCLSSCSALCGHSFRSSECKCGGVCVTRLLRFIAPSTTSGVQTSDLWWFQYCCAFVWFNNRRHCELQFNLLLGHA